MTEFVPIFDPVEARRAAAAARRLVDGPWHLSAEALARGGWEAVPVEKGRHLEEDGARALARALTEAGHGHCYAVAAEPLGEHPSVYRAEATAEGLLKFSEECAGLNFVLLPPDASAAVLCTTEDYNLYAGPPAFLRRALGRDTEAARAAFREYASDEWWEGRLLEVARRYGDAQA
ncbi:MAG TPA: hypothetical protein VF621_13870 [Pyrinomonadaceae bacterium]|jgi:hypothetical protein